MSPSNTLLTKHYCWSPNFFSFLPVTKTKISQFCQSMFENRLYVNLFWVFITSNLEFLTGQCFSKKEMIWQKMKKSKHPLYFPTRPKTHILQHYHVQCLTTTRLPHVAIISFIFSSHFLHTKNTKPPDYAIFFIKIVSRFVLPNFNTDLLYEHSVRRLCTPQIGFG